MIKENLITACVCGNTGDFEVSLINNLNIVKCGQCGIKHQELKRWTVDQYFDFYKTDYHLKYQKKKGVVSYADRYQHDCMVAGIRLEAYSQYLTQGMKGLDVGSSNSAFVHEARKQGLDCLGLEPGNNIGDDGLTIRATLEQAELEQNHYDFVTMHDSIEHMIDVNSALNKVHSILKPQGLLILDLPDYYIPEGQHHWKYIEHLWFFTRSEMMSLLSNHGFAVVHITTPIPGKVVFYSRKTNT